MVDKIKIWAKSSIIKQEHSTPLLKILKQRFPEFPCSAKTLFKSHYDYKIIQFENNDEFVYFGIANQLKKQVNAKLHNDLVLLLQFHVDGFSPFKSSKKEFWPILC